jgi:hypothetical protein
MHQRTTVIIAFSFILIIATVLVLFQNSILSGRNKELSDKLESTQNQLEDINQKYSNLQDEFRLIQNNSELSPAIETRLGIKVMGGTRYPNYLWVTGEVINRGNLTLYNAKLRFILYTTNGTDTKEYILGTMLSNQAIEMRFTAYSSLGIITDWKIEPVATYRP